MKKSLTFFSIFLLLFLFSACSQSDGSSPKSAFDEFYKALRDADINKMVDMTEYDQNIVPYSEIVRLYHSAVEANRDATKGIASWQIGEAVYQNDIKAKVYATICHYDGTLDLDSIFLIKVNGKWRIDIEKIAIEIMHNQPPQEAGELVGAALPNKKQSSYKEDMYDLKSEPSTIPVDYISEEDILAIRQQEIADSIAQANEQARKNAENLIGVFTFTNIEEQGTSSVKTEKPGTGSTYKGEGDDGGNKWSLAGRCLIGGLPKPKCGFNEEGKVVVQIRVNAAGDVVEANSVAGTYVNDRQTIQLALDAAKKAKFTRGDSDVMGTITYKF